MLDINQIMERIPQRPPLLLLDRVTDLSGEKAQGFKNVTMSEAHFKGHFPGNPVMPGVLNLEALVQLSWILFVNNPESSLKPKKIELCGVDRLKFRRPVKPGDRLDLSISVKEESPEGQDSGHIKKVSALSSVDGETACEGILSFELVF